MHCTIRDNPVHLDKYITKPKQLTLNQFSGDKPLEFTFSPNHHIIDMNRINMQTLQKAYELQPRNYEELVAVKGIGPKSVRSLALIADLIFGAKASWKDPVKYSFAHGGKDGIPYPVDRGLMDDNVSLLRSAVENARLGNKDKLYAIRRLNHFLKY